MLNMASVQAAKHGTEWPVNPSIATIIFIKDRWRLRPRLEFFRVRSPASVGYQASFVPL